MGATVKIQTCPLTPNCNRRRPSSRSPRASA